MFVRFFQQLAVLSRFPEMKVLWIFLPFFLASLILNLFALPAPLSYVSAFLFLLLGGIVSWTSWHAASVNLRTTTERNELEGIVRSLADALVAYDQNFRIIFFNAAAENLFALKSAQVVGRDWKPQDVERAETRLLAQVIFPSLAPSLVSRTRSGEYPQVTDISFVDPQLDLRVITTPISDEKGRLLGFMKIIRNRTRELLLQKSKEEFITVASHQLRTPITELNWGLQALSQDPTLRPETKEIAERASGSARKLLTLVEDLLNASKIEEGRFGYAFTPTQLVQYLEQYLAEAMPHVEQAGLKLYFDRPKEPLPEVMVDHTKLSMVLGNLLDNAVRYNVPHGEITVSLRPAADGPYAEVSVKDTGIGIPTEEIDKLFSKFYRSTNALKFQTEGSGLGLYIAKNIIQAHGGRMWAESELNRGTTMSFSLPTDPSLIPKHEVVLE